MSAVVTVPDPEDPDRRDSPRRDSSSDTDAAFASIIAGWRVEPDVPPWPADEDRTDRDQGDESPDQSLQAAPHRIDHEPAEDRQPTRAAGRPLPDPDDDHFEPPEPPPLPVPQPRTLGGLLLVAVGLLLLVNPNLIALTPTVATPLGLLGMAGGIGWLMFNLRGGPPPEGWDDGARL